MSWSQPANSTPVAVGGTWTPQVQTFRSAYQLAQAGAAPQQAQYQLNNMAGMRGIGDQLYGGQLDAAGQQLQYQGQMGDLGAQIGTNAIDLAAAQRQDPYYAQLQNLSGQDYQNTLAALGLTHDTNLADLLSQQTSQGSTQTKGNRQQKGFINLDYFLGAGKANIAQQQSQLTLAEQRQSAKDRAAQLQIEANNLGTKPELLQQQLQNALSKAGLSTKMSVDQLMDGLAKNDLDSVSLYNQLIQWSQNVANAAGK
jgi:hypothetical protein